MSIFAVFAASMLIIFGIRMIAIFGINKCRHIRTFFETSRPPLAVLLRHVPKIGSQPLGVMNHLSHVFDYKPVPFFVPSKPLQGLCFIVSSPEDVAAVMKNKHMCEKSELYYMCLSEYTKKNVLVTNGEVWSRSRRTIDHGFHKQAIESYVDDFNTTSQRMLDELQKNYLGKDIDMSVFGFENLLCASAILTAGSEFTSKNETCRMENAKFWHELMVDVLYLVHRSSVELLFSSYKFLLKLEQRTRAAVDKITSETLEFIVNHKKKVEHILKSSGNTFRANSLLEHVVVRHAAAGKMLLVSDEELTADIMFVALAGAETTSRILTLVMAMLALHPETQLKVREEVRSIFDESNRPVTLCDLKHMTQLENVINETLRLFPAVPVLGRSVKEDANVNGTFMPKGSTILIDLMALHRNPYSFENPNQFDPNRFLPENIHKIPPYAYLPFSGGPRKCPGRYYAMIQLKTLIASFIRKFEFLPGEGFCTMDDIHVDFRLTLHFTKKLHIRVKLLEPGKATS